MVFWQNCVWTAAQAELYWCMYICGVQGQELFLQEVISGQNSCTELAQQIEWTYNKEVISLQEWSVQLDISGFTATVYIQLTSQLDMLIKLASQLPVAVIKLFNDEIRTC